LENDESFIDFISDGDRIIIIIIEDGIYQDHSYFFQKKMKRKRIKSILYLKEGVIQQILFFHQKL
jgi:hypothetical protein